MTSERRPELQWLRAFAAIEVIICHSDLLIKHFSPYRVSDVSWYYPVAATGVELFFLLSGYVICMRASQVTSAGSFFLSRVYRLFPMYWIFTSLVGVAHLVNPAWPENFSFDPVSVITSYLILPQPGFPLLSVGWTLQHEMLFYAVVVLMMYAIGLGRGLMLAVAPLLGLMGFIGCVFGSGTVPSLWAYYIFSPFMFAFGLGWLIRSCEEAGWRAIMLPAALFGGFGLLALVFGGGLPGHIIYRIMVASLIFVTVISFRQFAKTDSAVGQVIYNLGDASFSIYLSHWFVLSAIGKMIGAIRLPAAADLPVRLLFIPVSVAVGYCFYVTLEKPISRWLRRPSGVPPENASVIAAMLQKLARRPAFAAATTMVVRSTSQQQIQERTASNEKRPAERPVSDHGSEPPSSARRRK